MTATLTAAAAGPAITGTVTFYAGEAALGSASVEAAAPGAGGAASATATLTAAASDVENSTVAAYYSGDANYAAGPPFVLTAPSLTYATVLPGQGDLFQLNIIPTHGFTGTVNLACGPVPDYLNCAVTPATASITGANPATIQAALSLVACTPSFSAAPWGRHPAWPWLALACLLPGLAAAGLRRRRWIWIALTGALAIGSLGCGGAPRCTYTGGGGTAYVIATSGSTTVKQGLSYFVPQPGP